MMDRIYYKLVSKELINIAASDYVAQDLVRKKINKFARKHGFDTKKYYVWNRDGGFSISGLYTKDRSKVDRKLWSENDDGSFKPKRNTKEGKAIYKEFEQLEWMPKAFQEAVKFKGIFHEFRYYSFNPFAVIDKKIFGFAVPYIPKSSEGSTEAYKPVKGIKQIKVSQYHKLMGE